MDGFGVVLLNISALTVARLMERCMLEPVEGIQPILMEIAEE